MKIIIPKGKIYQTNKGWKIKGWFGISPTKQLAQRRFTDRVRYINKHGRFKYFLKRASYDVERLGGFPGAAYHYMAGDIGKLTDKYERQLNKALYKRNVKISQSKKQTKLQKFGFPKWKRHHLPYAFKY